VARNARRGVIGDCGTHAPVDAAGFVEIGYGLAAHFRGQGYGTEVVAAISDWLLSQPEVRVIRATIVQDNAASRRVLEKARFKAIGITDSEAVYERYS
jgi:ribosomal-protein-alanine N-acetyltransferase